MRKMPKLITGCTLSQRGPFLFLENFMHSCNVFCSSSHTNCLTFDNFLSPSPNFVRAVLCLIIVFKQAKLYLFPQDAHLCRGVGPSVYGVVNKLSGVTSMKEADSPSHCESFWPIYILLTRQQNSKYWSSTDTCYIQNFLKFACS